jgi:hypothetical protein
LFNNTPNNFHVAFAMAMAIISGNMAAIIAVPLLSIVLHRLSSRTDNQQPTLRQRLSIRETNAGKAKAKSRSNNRLTVDRMQRIRERASNRNRIRNMAIKSCTLPFGQGLYDGVDVYHDADSERLYYSGSEYVDPFECTDWFYDAAQDEFEHSMLYSTRKKMQFEEVDTEQIDTDFMAYHVEIAMSGRTSGAQELGDVYDSDSFIIAVDNCCSRCITNNINDFVGTPIKVDVRVKGIGGSVVATHKGTVKWNIEDDQGKIHSILIPNSYYNKESPYRLFSPQHFSQSADDHFPKQYGTWCGTYDDAIVLHWDQRRYTRTIKLDAASNIGLFSSAPGFSHFSAFCQEISGLNSSPLEEDEEFFAMNSAAEVSDDDEANDPDGTEGDVVDSDDDSSVESMTEGIISRRHPDVPDEVFGPKVSPADDAKEESIQIPEDKELQYDTAQAELLGWHYRLGHIPFAKIKKMAGRGDLPAYLARAKPSKCSACLFAKATKRAWRSRSPVNSMTTPPATSPGAVVAVDQLISGTPGLIGQLRGFITGKRYLVATVFVDHFSGLSFTYLQKSTTAIETIEAKHAFERFAKVHGVSIKHYHADNGIFVSTDFVKAINHDGQTISYCAVNAHHQNGRAEKKIRDLQELARAMILHAKQRWPNAITANLWPYALRNANDISNSAPGIKDGISPMEKFSQVKVSPKVRTNHTFGCPVYVLDSRLQEGQSIPKWDEKARIGIYLGMSPRHSRKVALVLNLQTGHVSPQFHVVFDDLFETLRPSAGNMAPKSEWQTQTGFVHVGKQKKSRAQRARPTKYDAPAMGIIPDSEMGINEPTASEESVPMDEAVDEPESADWDETWTSNNQQAPDDVLADVNPTEVPPIPAQAPTHTTFGERAQQSLNWMKTRSGRISKPTTRWAESMTQQQQGIVSLHVAWEVFHDGGYDIQDDMEDPIAFTASTNPDIMYLDQALKEPDSKQFQQAMLDEVQSHTDNGHWEVIWIWQVPEGEKILPSVWAMRRKRRIATGEAYRWKARLNLHGGKQEYGLNYWETYSPVIAWTTVRLFLILTLLNGWSSRQVDFVLAFPQADVECPLYMEIPRGFKFQGSRKTHCLSLKKNLYGAKQAGRVWNEYLHDGLIARGFRQSSVDMCLYYRGSVALMFYVDDGIFVGPKQEDIDECYDLLTKPCISPTEPDKEFRAFKMTNEGDISDYLGVKVEKLKNGCIKLSQPHLIQKILDDLGFNERTKTAATPAASTIKLGRDLHGAPYQEDWHYRSVIGKLNFLEKSTRLDLAYSVHQCARFSADPKESHATAVKRIGKYLMATKDKGIILNPKDHSFDCWVDADFVGNWDRVNADVDPSTAKSRTGFIITYAACPVVWGSKLQSDVALSTTESEYSAVSTSLREVIHLMQLIDEVKTIGWKTFEGKPTVHCKVFEDNAGALEMVRLPKMRPRTKHICVRMHHFREHVRKGLISVHKIPTRFQLGDIATKPQPEDLFVEQRESLMQWKAEYMTKEELLLDTSPLRACDISDSSKTLCELQEQETARVKERRARSAKYQQESVPRKQNPMSDDSNNPESTYIDTATMDTQTDSENTVAHSENKILRQGTEASGLLGGEKKVTWTKVSKRSAIGSNRDHKEKRLLKGKSHSS